MGLVEEVHDSDDPVSSLRTGADPLDAVPEERIKQNQSSGIVTAVGEGRFRRVDVSVVSGVPNAFPDV